MSILDFKSTSIFHSANTAGYDFNRASPDISSLFTALLAYCNPLHSTEKVFCVVHAMSATHSLLTFPCLTM